MTSYDVRVHRQVPDPAVLRQLLVEYSEGILERFLAVGGPALDPADLVDPFVETLDSYRMPDGCIVLAHDAAGGLVGCGTIRKIRPDAAEMKRMFVRPEARRKGLGKAIFDMRVAEARRLGVKTLYADTVRGNTEMLRLYEAEGFTVIPRYDGNANPPEYAPFLVYLEKRL